MVEGEIVEKERIEGEVLEDEVVDIKVVEEDSKRTKKTHNITALLARQPCLQCTTTT